MDINKIYAIVLIVAAVVVVATCIFTYIRNKSLSNIREDVYQLFRQAENDPKLKESGRKRMKWVLQQARALLPTWVQPLITDAFLEKVVERWFRAIKDLLDNGRIDKSQIEEEK